MMMLAYHLPNIIPNCCYRESGPVEARLLSVHILRAGASTAKGAAQTIEADHIVLGRIKRHTLSEERGPPGSDMGTAGQGVAQDDTVVLGSVEMSP